MKTILYNIIMDEARDTDIITLRDNENKFICRGNWFDDCILSFFEIEVLCHWRDDNGYFLVFLDC